MNDNNMVTTAPFAHQQNIPVVLACGCQDTWKDGFDLWQAGQYAYCQTHGDTAIAEILAEPQGE